MVCVEEGSGTCEGDTCEAGSRSAVGAAPALGGRSASLPAACGCGLMTGFLHVQSRRS